MAARPASPDRYVVDRIGTPDPAASVYFVLDVVHDYDARVALAGLGRHYSMRGKHEKASECFELLHSTKDAHRAAVEEHNKLTAPKESKARKQAAN